MLPSMLVNVHMMSPSCICCCSSCTWWRPSGLWPSAEKTNKHHNTFGHHTVCWVKNSFPTWYLINNIQLIQLLISLLTAGQWRTHSDCGRSLVQSPAVSYKWHLQMVRVTVFALVRTKKDYTGFFFHNLMVKSSIRSEELRLTDICIY